MEMSLLNALSMIALRIGKAEQAFFEEITANGKQDEAWNLYGCTNSSSFQKANATF
jgi:hypothetical protein